MMKRLFFVLMLFFSLAHADDLLHPSVAFRPSAHALDAQTIEARFAIANGYYLYRNKFRFAVEPVGGQLGTPILPKGKEIMDETFGKVEVYYKEAAIRLPVERNSSGNLPLTLTITSQGCADIGICFPPQKQTLSLELPDPGTTPIFVPDGDESGRIAQLLKNADLRLILASFFGFGLLLSLTPCVFPMIPILSGIIVGASRDGHGVSHARGFLLSLAYVLGMAVTYSAAGIAAGFTGTLLSTALQNSWVIGGFALIFVALAFSMFGLYELQLPLFLQSKVSEETSHIKSGSLPGVAAMGALSALIVGPCVAAPLAGALLYIGQTGDALLGGMALFCLALGIGVPLLLVGLSAGSLLPKSGPWMELVKKLFGVILLGTALWFISPFIPNAMQMSGWALFLIIPAILILATIRRVRYARGWQLLLLFVSFVMLVYSALIFAAVFTGTNEPRKLFSGLRADMQKREIQRLPFERIRSLADLDARLKTSSKPVMLDFYADWCVSCKEMERDTFSDTRVQNKLADWTLLQADVTANSEDDKALLARFKLFGPPGIIFFDAQGKEVSGIRVIGFQNADDFITTLARLRQ